MKALVTGVAGFIGSSLAARMLHLGWDVVGVDSLTDYYDPTIKVRNLERLAGPQFTFIHGDLNNINLTELLDGTQVISHQAGQPGVRKSWGRTFEHYTNENIAATQRLLEAARDLSSLQRLVYASSSSVYGDAEAFPVGEKQTPKPRSPYGVTKLAAEHLCSLYASNFGLPTVSLRYFTVYGPRQRPDMAFTRFMLAAIAGQEITVYGNGEQRRDFTFVEDVVEANMLALQTPNCQPGAVFNVSGGSDTSVNEVIAHIRNISQLPVKVSYSPTVAGDVLQTSGDTSAIREALGWEPHTKLSDGLVKQYNWAESLGI